MGEQDRVGVRVRGQETGTREGKGKVSGGKRGSVLVKEHPSAARMECGRAQRLRGRRAEAGAVLQQQIM